MKKVIFDGDMGGDDLWALVTLVSLIKQKKIDLLGITTSFGNTTLDQATRNVCDMLAYLHQTNIPVFKGANTPMGDIPPLLDGAFGETGLSLATLPQSSTQPQNGDAVSWIAQTLKETNDHVTLISTGPATNLATVFERYPELDKGNVEILWFGGAIMPAGANHLPKILPNGKGKIGNITDFAEFNAINDVIAAQILANLEKAKITFVPMDATQHMDVGLSRITHFLHEMRQNGLSDQALTLVEMLHDVAGLDEKKLGAKGTYIHDEQVIQNFANPELFLPTVGIQHVQFTGEFELAKKFDAVASEFDFSLLGQHGQMHLEQANKPTNKFIMPGLTTFKPINDITKTDIDNQENMASARWSDLEQHIVRAFKP